MLKKKGKTGETTHLDVTVPHREFVEYDRDNTGMVHSGVEVVVCQETPVDGSEFTNRADDDVANKGTGEKPVVSNKVCVCVCTLDVRFVMGGL